MSRIVEVGIPFGRTNTKAIVVPSDSKDGIMLLKGVIALFFKSKESAIVAVEDAITSIGKLFFTAILSSSSFCIHFVFHLHVLGNLQVLFVHASL